MVLGGVSAGGVPAMVGWRCLLCGKEGQDVNEMDLAEL